MKRVLNFKQFLISAIIIILPFWGFTQITDSCLFRSDVVKKLTNITLVPNVEVSPGPGRFYGYVEYKPTDYDPSRKYGLIIFFHGMSGMGDGSANDYRNGLCTMLRDSYNTILGIADGLADGKTLPEYILKNYIIFAPQYSNYNFVEGNPEASDYPTDRNVEDAINFALNIYNNIDEDALVLVGMSSGANMLTQYLSSSVERASRSRLSIILSNCTRINVNPIGANAAEIIAASTTQTYFVGCLPDLTCNYSLSSLNWVNQINGLNPIYPAILNTISTADSCFTNSHNTWTYFFDPNYRGAPGGLNVYEFMEITAIVPVTLKYFEARLNGNTVYLDWVTLQEQNTNHFIIEKATEFQDFIEIARIKGAGNANHENLYSFEDKKPFPGVNYYRLIQVDVNGKKKVYPIRKVINNNNTLSIVIAAPNPFRDNVSIFLDLKTQQRLNVYITDISGRKLISRVNNFKEGRQEISLNTASLSPGIYFLRIEGAGIFETQKIIKQ